MLGAMMMGDDTKLGIEMGWIEHFIHPEYKNGLWDGEGRLFPWTDGWFVYGSQLQSQSQLQVQLDSFQHNIVTVEKTSIYIVMVLVYLFGFDESGLMNGLFLHHITLQTNNNKHTNKHFILKKNRKLKNFIYLPFNLV
ncbi:hypothetical protein EYC84_010417 [Monilinia fructicola]|uniref:Uncharacterized protein n=1 Tax=Monilinia fructicola TaxID=38448 RepID=A0A5M9JCR2_MONFR|nr:hypothetical protein EYC84_010417 [Monilinia fructicola]